MNDIIRGRLEVHIDSVSVAAQIASLELSVLSGRTAKLPTSVRSLLIDGLEGIPKLEMERVAHSGQWKATRSQLVLRSNTPQGQHMHLRHITRIIQKPYLAALPHNTLTFCQVKCPGTPLQRVLPRLPPCSFLRVEVRSLPVHQARRL